MSTELIAQCTNVNEWDETPCDGEIRFRWGQVQAACDTCRGFCGIAVATWVRVETEAQGSRFANDTTTTPDAGAELLTVTTAEVWSAVLTGDGGQPDGVVPNTAQCNRTVGLLRRRSAERNAKARLRLLAAIETVPDQGAKPDGAP